MEFSATTDTLPSLGVIGHVLNPDAGTKGGRDLPHVGAIAWPLVVALASDHLVTPALHPRLDAAGLTPHLDPELRRYFHTVAELNRGRNLRIHAQLAELVDLLGHAGIRPVFLKGAAHLLLGLYREIADRVIGDIDLVVAEDELDETIRVLTKAGYGSGQAPSVPGHHHHHPALSSADREVCVEVHKHAVKRIYGGALPTSALIRRARMLSVAGGQAAIPCAEDLLVHNILHSQVVDRGFWSAEFSLRDGYDGVLLARRYRDELDWTRLAARLRKHVGGSVAGFYLRRAHLLLGQAPPPLPWPPGARLADRCWALHAAGRMTWLRPATRLLGYGSQGLRRLVASGAERRWWLRRLAAAEWYGGRWRALTDRGWREAGRLD